MVKKVVELSGIYAGYGGEDVLMDISFSVEEREILCVLGPNGSGKTTILDCVTGFRKVKEGEVEYGGRSSKLFSASERGKLIASIPQHQSYTFPFTVFDMVCMGRAHSISLFKSPGKEDRQIVEKVLSLTGLEGFRDRYFSQLSGGEAQMVMFARALAQGSRIFVMDEPTAHLDFRNELMVLGMVGRSVDKLGKTVVMATHFPNHIFFFINSGLKVKVLMIKDGRVVEYGEAVEVLTEENLKLLYGVDCRIGEIDSDGNNLKFLLPVDKGVSNEEVFESIGL